ncbi:MULTISPECIES: siderophore-interacting protein [Actinosynnema]|uniref:siderophore-interacting protein n=1 Tax=Actinosynnema TaxID=40566 RepID=UPI0020A5DF12|nr:siderophore-interacting protein [Actinosynnema pretiosum]MCP2096271.1 NADPH-dependent ferric siderophore reductase, contains FAD-binding and SIP domains [Actinosynnema pretiosum]
MLALTVSKTEFVVPQVVRITFTGEGLDAIHTWPDQQVKLLFPRPGRPLPELVYEEDTYGMGWYQAFMAIPEPERPWMRSYTIRHHRREQSEVDIDFVLHEDSPGPATTWATTAKPGDVIGRYGPSAAYTRPLKRADWYLFAGDATALPAMASLIESLPEGATILAMSTGPEQPFPLPGIRWVDDLATALADTELPTGTSTAWVAGEASVVRALRRHLVQDRGLDRGRVEFTGYWRKALAQDDAPTDEDLADAREKTQ